MQWQDFVLTAGSLAFSAALIPSLLSNDKPALSSSLMTGFILLVFSAVYLTLSLWFSAASIALNAAVWLALAVQKWKQKAEPIGGKSN